MDIYLLATQAGRPVGRGEESDVELHLEVDGEEVVELAMRGHTAAH